MSSAQRVLTTEEADNGFSLLRDIVGMVKNPKAIDEAYERRRKAAELTDDEVAAANDARAFIARADALRTELKQREDSLDAAKAEYEKTATARAASFQEECATLDVRKLELDATAQQQAQTEAAQQSARDKLNEDLKAGNAALDARSADLDAREKIIKSGEDANAQKAQRLAELQSKLQAKAARLAAEASKDD